MAATLTLASISRAAAQRPEVSLADAGLGSSTISGVVRDAQGTAQMGALVQVLAANSLTVATAFTDQHGRYFVPNLTAGNYLVRASATLFVPATRSNLQLHTGASAVVNLTLAALFDTASWLPAQRRRADESPDEWKWTLRSTANRPILRIIDEGSSIEVSSSAESKGMMRARALETVESGDGQFGQGGVHNIVTIHRLLDDGSEMLLRADMGTSALAGPDGSGGRPLNAGSEVDAGYENKTGFDGGSSRTVVSYKSHPELVGAVAGVDVTQIASAQRMNLGERVEVEAGGRLEAVHAGQTAFATRPFVRISAHPSGEWTLEYRMASDREVQSYEDVTSSDGDVPVAVVEAGRLALESGRHQELSFARRTGRASVQMAFYHDGFSRSEIAGGQGGATVASPGGVPVEAQPVSFPAGMLLDPTTGSFRALAAGYTSSGARVTVSSALTPSLWIAASYSSGEALAVDSSALGMLPLSFEQALGLLTPHHSQTATLALKGKLIGTGTRVRASYRWQPVGDVTAVDSYGAFGDQAYLSCLLRQPIHVGRLLPQGLAATIDVTNLLAQGYRPFLSADGQTLFFAQSPRTIQAGLSFSF